VINPDTGYPDAMVGVPGDSEWEFDDDGKVVFKFDDLAGQNESI